MRKYFYSDDSAKHGPFSLEELLRQNLTRDTHVWFYGLDNWLPLCEIDELKSVVNSIPPQISVPEQKVIQNSNDIPSIKVDDKVVMVDKVRAKASSYVTAPIIRVGSRMEENDGVVWTTPSTVGSSGYADMRSSGRFNKIEVTLGDDQGIMEMEADVKERGRR